MSLVINGIDFDKRCDDAKHQLHINIEWRANVYELLPYFNACRIIPERNDSFLKLWMERRRPNGYIPLDIKWEGDVAKYLEAIKEYIESPQTWPRI